MHRPTSTPSSASCCGGPSGRELPSAPSPDRSASAGTTNSRLLERKRQLIRVLTILGRSRTGRTADYGGRLAGPARSVTDEVLPECALLPLVRGSDVLAVEQ